MSIFDYWYYAGPSLHFAPSMPEIRVDSGNNAVLQCVLDHGGFTHGGSFSWTGPAIASGRAVIDSSLTVSTLTIDNVGRSDEGRYSCAFTRVESVFISLDVVCKLHAIFIILWIAQINGSFHCRIFIMTFVMLLS